MKKQILNVSKFQTAKVMAVLYLFVSLPMVLLMMIASWLGAGEHMPWFMLVLTPVLYTVIGFVFTLIGAWIYNAVAARVGGIEFTMVEAAEG